MIPGSSIQQVYVDSLELYQQVEKEGNALLSELLAHKASENPSKKRKHINLLINTFNWNRNELLEVDESLDHSLQKIGSGKSLVYVSVPANGIHEIDLSNNSTKLSAAHHVSLKSGTSFVLENQHLRAEFTAKGLLKSLIYKKLNRECIEKEKYGNQFVLFEDIPFFWDAW